MNPALLIRRPIANSTPPGGLALDGLLLALDGLTLALV
jgi:hypothetical protein